MPRSMPIIVLSLVAATATAALAGRTVVVSQQNRAFRVSEAQLSRGDVVRFTNDDTFLHQVFVRSPALDFESAEQEPGQAVEVRFPASGTFEVRCRIHPKMLLRVDVR